MKMGTKAETASISEAMASFSVHLRPEDVPFSAWQVLNMSLLDWCAVGLAGWDEPVSRIVRDMVVETGGAGEATLFGSEVKVPAAAAALSNGTTSHALDYDDTHFLHVGHPSVVVASASLAVAQKVGASGQEFLTAFLAGFEASCRIGHWLGRSHYEAGFHQTATAGCFGAAISSARLLGLNGEQTRHVLGLAATRASGLKSQFGTMGKPYNAGLAASNGVEVALLVSRGLIANPQGLEGRQGFGEIHHGANTDLNEVLAGLGERFVLEEVSHKYHACCHGIHAAIEALNDIRISGDLKAEDVDRVDLWVNPRWRKVCHQLEPDTGLAAKFSYRLVSAMTLSGVDTGALSVYSEATCRDAALVALRDRVHVTFDEDVPDAAAKASVMTRSGERFDAAHDLNDPVLPTERERRVRRKAASLIGDAREQRLFAMIAGLETIANIRHASLF